MINVVQMIRREQSTHPNKPKGCNGWWHEGEQVLLHGAGACPVCDDGVCGECKAGCYLAAQCSCARGCADHPKAGA